MGAPVAIGTVIAERYRIDRVLGEGGMGVVVMAEHLLLQQRVAIKFLRRDLMKDAGAVERFVREARAAAKVQSDRVVRVHDVAALDDGTPFIVMEYLDGRDLSVLLAEKGMLSVEEAIDIAVQTCEALAQTHSAGIVHGDLKPENVYLASTPEGVGRVKLLDFGISRIFVEDAHSARMIAGTPSYMAPEQFEGGAADLRSDIWALGAVLYEMLAGTPPFGTDSTEAIRARVLGVPMPALSRKDVPDRLHEVIQRCLQKSPQHRFSDPAQLAKALEPWLERSSASQRIARVVSRRQPTPMPDSRSALTVLVRPERRARRRPGTYLAVGALFLASTAGTLALVSVLRENDKAPVVAARASTTPPIPVSAPTVVSAATASVTTTATVAIPSAVASASNAPTTDPPPPSTSRAIAVAPPRARVPRVPPPDKHPPVAPPDPAASGADRFGTRK